MDLDRRIIITDEQGIVQIPLANFLRLFLIYGSPVIHQFLADTQTSDITSFHEWLKIQLGVKPEDKILL